MLCRYLLDFSSLSYADEATSRQPVVGFLPNNRVVLLDPLFSLVLVFIKHWCILKFTAVTDYGNQVHIRKNRDLHQFFIRFQIISPVPVRPCVTFLNEGDFYSVRLLVSRQTLKLEDHSWSAVHDCLFNIFAATFHIWRPTPPSATQGTRHSLVTGTHRTKNIK